MEQVRIRWSSDRPPATGGGYEKMESGTWVPVSEAEVRQLADTRLVFWEKRPGPPLTKHASVKHSAPVGLAG